MRYNWSKLKGKTSDRVQAHADQVATRDLFLITPIPLNTATKEEALNFITAQTAWRWASKQKAVTLDLLEDLRDCLQAKYDHAGQSDTVSR